VQLSGGLDALAADLAWLPKERLGAERACTAMGGSTTYYLLGLTYGDGVVWVSGAKDPNTCDQSWNGRFASGNLGDALETSFAQETWAGGFSWAPTGPPTGSDPCGLARSGRLGDDRRIVPPGAVRLRVCRDDPQPDGATTTVSRDAHDQAAAVAAVVDGLDRHDWDFSCTPKVNAATVTYWFVFGYAAGPPVVVRVDPNCPPAVTSGRFAVDDGTPLVRLADRLLAGG
jgi:hypothetical protein